MTVTTASTAKEPIGAWQLSDIAEAVGSAGSLTEAAARVVKYALELTGARWAEVVEVPPQGHFRILASTDVELSRTIYGLRRLTDDNPPLPDERPADNRIVFEDITHDGRWQALTAASAQLPLRSAVLEYLVVDSGFAGGLAVYDDHAHFFTQETLERIRLLSRVATPGLTALAAVERERNLHRALASNRDIGAAVGVLMSGRGLSQPDAFAALSTASQRQNRKLREVAADVLRTGRLPA